MKSNVTVTDVEKFRAYVADLREERGDVPKDLMEALEQADREQTKQAKC